MECGRACERVRTIKKYASSLGERNALARGTIFRILFDSVNHEESHPRIAITEFWGNVRAGFPLTESRLANQHADLLGVRL
jgi:hypothetical protein